jgi:hypothetical protein
MSDIDNLVDMGFDREKATLAMKKAGNCAYRPTSQLYRCQSYSHPISGSCRRLAQ